MFIDNLVETAASGSKDAAVSCLEARCRGRAVPEVCGGASHASGGQAFLFATEALRQDAP
jgi:hypothetical protein